MIRSTQGGASSPDLAVLTDEIVERIRHGEPVDIERLVERHPQHADALRDLLPMMQLLADLSQPVRDSADEGEALLPREIGDFRILRELGRGGMGVVYEARQLSLNRRAALKVLPFAAMFEEKQLARFKNEAQAAASLDHENIVHAYAVGCDRGVHYFAMQYIEGQNLAEAIAELRQARGGQPPADSPGEAEPPPTTDTSAGLAPPEAEDAASGAEREINKRSTDCLGLSSTAGERSGREYFKTIARLMAKAAEALDYAHQRGVVHRDVKPSNLLLDANQKIYVADFGLASIEGDRNLTTVGGVLGTARYMSPEQAAGDTRRVDHRTDIYSLGATLYELAALRPAFRGFGHAEFLRRIASEEPPALRKVNRRIPRDLETIVGKAMAKDPAERYATAAELAEDLRRFVDDQPILARPPGPVQRVTQFARKRVGILLATAATLLLLTIGSIVATGLIWYEHGQTEIARLKSDANAKAARAAEEKERTQRTKAEAAEAKQRELREHAEQAEQQAKATLEYLTAALRSPDPTRDGHTVTVVEVLDQAVDRLSDDHELHPLNRASILTALSETYIGLGLAENCIALLETAANLRQEHLGLKHPDTQTSMNNLACALERAGRFEDAILLHKRVLDHKEKELELADKSTLTTMINLSSAYMSAGRFTEAESILEKVLTASESVLGATDANRLKAMHNLAASMLESGQLERALRLAKVSLEHCRRVLGRDHPDTLNSMDLLARVYCSCGQFAEAVELHESVLEAKRQKLGMDHPDTLRSINNLACSYSSAGRFQEALELHEEALQRLRTLLGPEHPDTLRAMANLAGAYAGVGQHSKAIKLYRSTLELVQEQLGRDHPTTLTIMSNLARMYHKAGLFTEAIDLGKKTVDLEIDKLGAANPQTLLSMYNLAKSCSSSGKLDEAIQLYKVVLETPRTRLGPDHRLMRLSMNGLAVAYWRARSPHRAIPVFHELLTYQIENLGEAHVEVIKTKANLGVNYRDAEQFEEAISYLEEAYSKASQQAELRWVSGALLETYIRAGQKEKALALMETRVKSMRAVTPAGSTRLAGYLAINALNLLRLEAWVEAEEVIRECLAIREKQMPESWLTFNSKSQLGAALLGQGKLEEAEPLLLEGYHGMRDREDEIPAAGKVRLEEALTQLVKLYEAWDKPTEAARWRGILEGEKAAEGPPPPTVEARGQAAEPGEIASEAETVGAAQEED